MYVADWNQSNNEVVYKQILESIRRKRKWNPPTLRSTRRILGWPKEEGRLYLRNARHKSMHNSYAILNSYAIQELR